MLDPRIPCCFDCHEQLGAPGADTPPNCPECGSNDVGRVSTESGRLADAESIIDRISRELETAGVNHSGSADPRALKWDNPEHRRMVRERFDDFADDEAILPGFGETGRGENARDDCGDPHPFMCDSCGHRVDFGRTCSQSVCTRCAVAWARDLAINKSAKVRRVRKEKHHHTPDSREEHTKLHHQVISPSLGWYFDLAAAGYSLQEAQEITRNVVKDILDEMRAPSVLIRHSYRGKDDEGAIMSESDDRGAWKERLNSDRDWFGDVRDVVAWKPHYHAIAVGDWLQGGELTDRVEAETGWVIHRITGDDGSSLPDDGSMARALTYSVSHADIMVNPDSHNRSAVWEVGSFEGDGIANTGRFNARPSDLDWADAVVRRAAVDVLGLASGTTDCGAELPPVDDPDELARRILEELYPQHERPAYRDVDAKTDTILHHVAEGNLDVEVSTTSGGGGDVTVRDAWGTPVGEDGWGSTIPDVPGGATFDGADEPVVTTIVDDQDDHVDECDCGHDHDDRAGDQDGTRECDGTLIPLGEARERGLLEDGDWCQQAEHVDEAREADREYPDDLDPWRSSSPGTAIGAG